MVLAGCHWLTAPHSGVVENMKLVASSDQELQYRGRAKPLVCNIIGTCRTSRRIVSSIEHEELKCNKARVAMIKGFRGKIETKLT